MEMTKEELDQKRKELEDKEIEAFKFKLEALLAEYKMVPVAVVEIVGGQIHSSVTYAKQG
jgi:hypothetical protein